MLKLDRPSSHYVRMLPLLSQLSTMDGAICRMPMVQPYTWPLGI